LKTAADFVGAVGQDGILRTEWHSVQAALENDAADFVGSGVWTFRYENVLDFSALVLFHLCR